MDLSANIPAPKTFAPSREDVLSTLGFFFGDPGKFSPLRPFTLESCPHPCAFLTLVCCSLPVHSRSGEAQGLLGAPRDDLPYVPPPRSHLPIPRVVERALTITCTVLWPRRLP